MTQVEATWEACSDCGGVGSDVRWAYGGRRYCSLHAHDRRRRVVGRVVSWRPSGGPCPRHGFPLVAVLMQHDGSWIVGCSVCGDEWGTTDD